MNADKAVALIRKHRPKSESDLLKIGFTLRRIGGGSFRSVYLLVGTGLVAKIPHAPDLVWFRRCVRHSAQEVNAVRHINRSKDMEWLRPFMPNIHYRGRNSGIVVMDYYRVRWKAGDFAKIREINNRISEECTVWQPDVNRSNCGYDADGNLKILDCGRLFGGREK